PGVRVRRPADRRCRRGSAWSWQVFLQMAEGGGSPPPSLTSSTRRRTRCARSGDALEPFGEATSVALLGASKGLEPLGDLGEAFVAGRLREAGIHLGVLVGLTGDGRLEVVGGRTDRLAGHRVAGRGQEVEVTERVARLALGD